MFQAEAPHLVVSYLEAALAAGTASHVRYDNELAVKYVELALSGQPGMTHCAAPPMEMCPSAAHLAWSCCGNMSACNAQVIRVINGNPLHQQMHWTVSRGW